MNEEDLADFEQERLERLAKLDEYRREDDPDWRRQVMGDSYSIHEALHLAHVFGRMVDEHLAQHPIVLIHPHLYAISSKAGLALAKLYQAVGNIVPDEDEQAASSLLRRAAACA